MKIIRDGEIYEWRGGIEVGKVVEDVDRIEMIVTVICLELKLGLHGAGHGVNNVK